MRYFLRLSYNGAHFHGWQYQPNASSVQETIEEALKILMRKDVAITGAGRTDTGVNARVMYAHLDLDSPPADVKRFLLSLNRMIGHDIAVEALIQVPDNAHARFDATQRTYKYFVANNKNPFLYPFTWQQPAQLDYKLMNEAARILIDTDDFTSFAKLHSDAKTNICKVTEAEWREELPGINVFTITADRFLRNMVRAVVGTLVDVGRGKLGIEDFQRIINMKDRCAAGVSMPSQALFLWDIKYPYPLISL